MRDTDREVLLFIRDEYNEPLAVEPRSFEMHDSWSGESVSEVQLENLTQKGYLEKVRGSYEITPEGLQALTLEELDQTISDTNKRLKESNKSRQRSSAVQAIFSVGIISLTLYQTVLTLIPRGYVSLSMGIVAVGAIVIGLTFALGLPSLLKSLNIYRF